MASMTFLINDSSTGGNVPAVRLVITENADGSVTVNVTQLNGYVGDLRGLFFDIADESLIGTLSVVAAPGLTELQQGNDTIKDLGNGANMQGLLGDGGGYDVGVEFGGAGIGHGDDIRAFTFTLKTSAAGGLDLSDFSNVAFGARITSVGLDSNGDGIFESSRNGSAKIGETTFSVVSPGNNAVTLAEDEVVTAAGTNGNLLANDGAGAGDTLSITGWSAGATNLAPGATFTSAALYGATVTINANGSWTVDAGAADALAAGQTVSQTFTYTVLQNNVDGSSTQTASFTVTITGTNDAAIISGQSTAALTETNAAQSIGGDLNATDVDGPATFVAQTNTAGGNGHGTFSIDAAGTWTYTMNNAHDEFVAGQTYTDSVTVATADGTTQVITVTITGSNDAAVLSADVRNLIETNAPLATSGVLTISDVDSPATFVAQAGSAGAYGTFAVDAAGAWTYNANSAHDEFVAGQTYSDSFDVVSADGTHTSVTINILGTNDAAVVSSAVVALNETDAPLATGGTLTSDDVDNPDNVFVAASTVGAIGAFAIDAAGAWAFTANSAFDHLAVGQSVGEVFHVASIDGTPSTVTLTITGTNDAPVAVADTRSGAEDTTLTGTVATNDSDIDNGAVLSYAQVSAVAGLTINADGSYSFDAGNAAYQHLAQGVTADVVASYAVTDQHGASSASTLTITLTGANDVPVAVVDTNSGNEDTIITGTVAANDSDADDGAVLTYGQVGAVAGLTINADGSYSFDAGNAAYQHLAQGATTDVVASYTVTDQHSASSISTLTITLTGTNDTPVAIADTNSGLEDRTITGNVATNDGDADDGAVLSYAQVGAVAGLTINPDGSYTFDASNAVYQHLAQGATQNVVASYTVTDEHGAFANSTLTIALTGTNDTPIAVADTNAGNEDNIVTGTVATNDSDVDDGAVLTYATTGPVPAGLSFNSNGSYSFDASNTAYQHLAQSAVEVVTAGYTVTDEHGAFATSTLTITLTGTNDTPVAVADTNAGNEDTTITGTVATNDSDIDDGAVLSYATTGPVPAGLTFNSNGSYSFDAGNSAYQHLAQGATEIVTVGYTVTDEYGAFKTSTLTITLTGNNDTPVAVADTNAGNEDTIVSGTVATNDSDVDDGAVLNYATTGPVPAGLIFNSNGSYSFDAGNAAYQHLAQGATEIVTAGYTVTDEHGAFATSTLTITLTGTNDTPIAVADTSAGNEDTTIAGTVATNDSDADDGAVLSYATAGPVPAGLTFNSNGVYSFDAGNVAYQHLAQGATEVVTAGYTVTDEHGAFATSTLTITLTGTNDTPVAVADTNAGNEDTIISGTVATNDSDADDGAVLTYAQVGAVAGLTINADGSYSFDAGNAAYQQLAQGAITDVVASYTVTDQYGASSASTLTIALTGTNDAPVLAAVDVTGAVTEALTPLGNLGDSGTIAFSDVDLTDMHSVSAVTPSAGTLGSLTAAVTTGSGLGGVVTWNYSVAASAVEFLAAGQTKVETFSFNVQDGQGGSVPRSVSVTITGTNDAPDIQVVTTDSAAASLAETNTTLSASGTLTVTDADTTDTVSSSVTRVTLAGTTGGLSAAHVLAMLTVSPTSGLAANSGDAHNLTWTFNSGAQAFDFLGAGQSLTLNYTVQSSDNNAASDTQVVSVTITGTNDAPADLALTISTVLSGTNLPSNTTFGQFSVPTGAEPDAGGAYVFSLLSLTESDLTGALLTDNGGADLAVSSAGALSTGNGNAQLDSGRIYELNVQVAQGAATYAESFSVITGTNSGETLVTGAPTNGDDAIYGLQGNDTILAGSGNDTAFGQNGDDTIYGGDGNDLLNGGGGNDIFVFDTTPDAVTNVDTIQGFNANTGDKIHLDDDAFAQFSVLANTTLAAGNFVANSGGIAGDTDDYILYDSSTGGLTSGWLWYDADGSGGGAAIHFATLLPGVTGTVDNTDFLIIP